MTESDHANVNRWVNRNLARLGEPQCEGRPDGPGCALPRRHLGPHEPTTDGESTMRGTV